MDLSRNMNRRLTLTYFQSVLDVSVRAPQTRMPRLGKLRMALTPRGLSVSWSASVRLFWSASAPRTISLAGALNTPRSVSVLAYTPSTGPPGGISFRAPVRGSDDTIHG